MNAQVVGRSFLGQPQIAYHFPQGSYRVLIIGGVHGDEYEGVVAVEGLLAEVMKNNPYKLDLTLLPRFNPDGILKQTRGNGRGIDLNRNLPTKDWTAEWTNPRYLPGEAPASEPENKYLVDALENKRFDFVISMHSWKPMLNINGDAREIAEVMANINGYRIDPDIGYPTPGSFGTYAGFERQCPTITYEIEEGSEIPKILELHVPCLHAALKALEKRSK